MRKITMAAVAALCLSSSAALAASSEYPTDKQTSQKCEVVSFERADVGAMKKFTITFKDADLAAIKGCNQGARIDSTANGVRIVVSYGSNGAVVKLPSDMNAGDAHTARCVPDTTGSIVDTVKYRAVWQGGLPDKLTLAKVDKAFFDSAKALEICKQLSVSGKVH
ncbi:MAG: hypothetical protein WC050_02130 [Candidatus Paceibacterota bacterium]